MCEICKHVLTTETFRSFSNQIEFRIMPNNLNCGFSNVHANNNLQVSLKVFDQDLASTNQPIGSSLKETQSNKRHFTLLLRMTNVIV